MQAKKLSCGLALALFGIVLSGLNRSALGQAVVLGQVKPAEEAPPPTGFWEAVALLAVAVPVLVAVLDVATAVLSRIASAVRQLIRRICGGHEVTGPQAGSSEAMIRQQNSEGPRSARAERIRVTVRHGRGRLVRPTLLSQTPELLEPVFKFAVVRTGGV